MRIYAGALVRADTADVILCSAFCARRSMVGPFVTRIRDLAEGSDPGTAIDASSTEEEASVWPWRRSADPRDHR